MKCDASIYWRLKIGRALFVASLLLISDACAAPPDAALAAFKRDVQAIVSSDGEGRADRIRRSYTLHFGAESVDTQASTESVKARLHALATVSLHAPDDGWATQAAALVVMLSERQAAHQKEAGYVHRMLLAERNFDAALQWAARFPDVAMPPTPQVERMMEALQPNAYAISADASKLLEVQLDMDSFTGLLILGHPACGFSRDAAGWLRSNTSATGGVAVRWLTPVDGNLQLPLLAHWNAENPAQALLIARHERQWPFVKLWDTPQFFMFSRGRLQLHLNGWNEPNQRALMKWLDNQSDALRRTDPRTGEIKKIIE